MIGKNNIVFGFFFLVLTAALGPVMIVKHFPAVAGAEDIKQQKVGALQQAQAGGYEVDLEKMSAEQIAKANTEALLALSARLNAERVIDEIKGGPHAHGNLEALLNIAVGMVLMFLAVPVVFKQAISWIFIAGTVLHSGLLFLATGLQFAWAAKWLASPVAPLGPFLILLGLLLTGIAAARGWQATPVKDAAPRKKKAPKRTA